jgi:hypothetical protein
MVACRYNKTRNEDNSSSRGNNLYFGRAAAIRRHLRSVHKITEDLDRWIEVEDALLRDTADAGEPVEDISEGLQYAQIEAPQGSNSYFIPIDVLDRLLTRRNIRQELRKICPDMEEQRREVYINAICSTSKKLFAILLCTSSAGNVRFICDFIDEGVNDADLPLTRVYPNGGTLSSHNRRMYTLARADHRSCMLLDHSSCGINLFSKWHRMEIQNLCRDQWLALAPVFESVPGNIPPHLSLDDAVVLPYIQDWELDVTRIKPGGYSEVWPVRIHPAHQKLLKSADPLVS